MTRALIVASHRTATPHGAGGVAAVLESVVAATSISNEVRWIGASELESSGDLVSAAVSERYRSLSNDALWPLYHDAAVVPAFDWESFASYRLVNQQMADAIVAAADQLLAPAGGMSPLGSLGSSSTPLVWVHDYHLQLAPAMVRALQSDLPIGFFLHIPFPPVEVFSRLPWWREVLMGVLGADLVGFQTQRDLINFRDACRHLLGGSVERASVLHEGRQVLLGCFPVGIDVAAFSAVAGDPSVQRRARELCSAGTKRLLSVDRLDYTKGVEWRLEIVIELMRSGRLDPATCEFVQVAVPTRQDSVEYRRVVESFAARMGTCTDLPIRWISEPLDRGELVAHYLAADVLLVTPFRDGMNLVSKEFVVTRATKPTGLVLSQFAGAAHELHNAVIVNPFDRAQMAEAIIAAANGDSSLENGIKVSTNVHEWAESFLRQLRVVRNPPLREPIPIERLARAERLLVCIDYDGTIAPLVDDPARALPLPVAIAALEELALQPDVSVAILSGRDLSSLQRLSGTSDAIALLGSYGAQATITKGKAQESLTVHQQRLLRQLQISIEESVAQIENAMVEYKWNSIAVHVRRCKPTAGRELLELVTRGPGQFAGVTVRFGKDVVELSVSDHEKADAVALLQIQTRSTVVLYVGDDIADEAVFALMNTWNKTSAVTTTSVTNVTDVSDVSDAPEGVDCGNGGEFDFAVGVHVGSGPTQAPWCVDSPDDVAVLLGSLQRVRKGIHYVQ